MAEPLTIFDPTEGLTSEEAIAAFMAEAVASNDAGYIAHAREVVARARQNNVAFCNPARSATQP